MGLCPMAQFPDYKTVKHEKLQERMHIFVGSVYTAQSL